MITKSINAILLLWLILATSCSTETAIPGNNTSSSIKVASVNAFYSDPLLLEYRDSMYSITNTLIEEIDRRGYDSAATANFENQFQNAGNNVERLALLGFADTSAFNKRLRRVVEIVNKLEENHPQVALNEMQQPEFGGNMGNLPNAPELKRPRYRPIDGAPAVVSCKDQLIMCQKDVAAAYAQSVVINTGILALALCASPIPPVAAIEFGIYTLLTADASLTAQRGYYNCAIAFNNCNKQN